MTMRLLLAACLWTIAASQSMGTCGDYTSGTCAWLSCRSSRGPTNCIKGQCICKAGYCSTGDACECDPETGGTCRLLGCSGSRGPTDCIKSKCFCKPGTCAIDGVCMDNDHGAKMKGNATLSVNLAGMSLKEKDDIERGTKMSWKDAKYEPHTSLFQAFLSLMFGFALPIAIAVLVMKKFGDGTPVVNAREPEDDFHALLG